MSFILDALRKSEADRQQQNAPGIASIPQSGSARSGPRWLWIAVALLLVNLAVLMGVLLKVNGDDAADIAANAGTPAVTTAPESSPAGSPVESTAAIKTAPAPAAAVSTSQLSGTAISTSENPAVATANGEPAGIPASSPPEAVAANSGNSTTLNSRETNQSLASFNELRARGVLNLPDLHLDIHVYSGAPDERFVFVNMAKYREKATLSEGPVVQEITPDGVILDYRGTDFLLPRE